jgi:hypothetical protein
MSGGQNPVDAAVERVLAAIGAERKSLTASDYLDFLREVKAEVLQEAINIRVARDG